MTKAEAEVITTVQRRRHWSRAVKERIIAAALEPAPAKSAYAVAQLAQILTKQQRSSAALPFWKQAIELEPAN